MGEVMGSLMKRDFFDTLGVVLGILSDNIGQGEVLRLLTRVLQFRNDSVKGD